jgi:dephospho-CoA kinase
MGCGKSTVGEMLEKKGMRRLDADAVVKELLANDEPLKQDIVAQWGQSVLQKDGSIDRAALATIVFADPQQLETLEGLLHPRVATVRDQRIAEHPEADWVVEIPLLFEKNLETQFDSVIAVYVGEDERVQRLLRKGFSLDTIQRRSQRQWSVSRKAELADYVLLNQGSLGFLEEQVSLLRCWLDNTVSVR